MILKWIFRTLNDLDKKSSTTKLLFWSRSTTLMLMVLPSETVWQIWISNHQNFSHTIGTSNDFKLKSHQLQSYSPHWDLQLWFCLIFHPRSFAKFEFQNFWTSDTNLRPQMIYNEKVVNYKVIDHSEICNFAFDHFFIWRCLYNSKKLNFKI